MTLHLRGGYENKKEEKSLFITRIEVFLKPFKQAGTVAAVSGKRERKKKERERERERKRERERERERKKKERKKKERKRRKRREKREVNPLLSFFVFYSNRSTGDYVNMIVSALQQIREKLFMQVIENFN